MAMIIKGRDPVQKGNKPITSTLVDGGENPDREGLDVYIVGGLTLSVDLDPSDIVDVSSLATAANQEKIVTGIGEVQETPSSNYSILGRLKAVATALAAGLKIFNRTTGTLVSGVTDPTQTFDFNATANTELTLATITAVSNASKDHLLTIENMSAVTAMTITVKPVISSFNGSDKDSRLAEFAVSTSTVKSFLVRGALIVNTKFTVKNDAQITDADAANRKVTMRLREL